MIRLREDLCEAAFLPVSEIANVGRQLADTLGGTRRLNSVHSEPVAVTDGPGVTVEQSSGTGAALELENLHFTYPGIKAPALDGVNLTLAPGRTLALVGSSGAGKTTLANLLMRFWDPEGGAVRLNGHDLKDWLIDDLRAHIALVAQDTYLFNDTIRANILIARPDASAASVAAAVSVSSCSSSTAIACGCSSASISAITSGSKSGRMTPLLGEAFLTSAITAAFPVISVAVIASAKPRGSS